MQLRNRTMNNNSFQQQILEVDFKELLWRILAQWKAIVLIALIMAVLVSGIKYTKDSRAYHAEETSRNEAAEQANIAPEKRIADILKDLSAEDTEAIEMVLREQEWLDVQKDYMEDSLFMSIDPANLCVLRLTYDIEGKDSKDVPVILQKYSALIIGDAYSEAIGAVIDPDIDEKYIGELISVTYSIGPEMNAGQTGAAINIMIILPDDIDTDEVAEASDKVLARFADKINGRYEHTISAAGSDISHEYSYETVNRHYDAISRINGMKSAVTNAENALTPEQKTVYESVKAIRKERDAAADAVTGGEADDELIAPGISKKYIVLGFMLGAFMYVALYVVLLIFKGSIYSAASTQNYTRKRLIGEVYYDNKPKGLSILLHSKLAEKLRYRNNADQAYQEDRIAESIGALCKHAGAKALTLFDMTDPGDSGRTKEILASIAAKTEDKGIDVDVIEASGDIDEKNMLNTEKAVFAVSGNTKEATLSRLMSLCADYDVDLLGSIYTAEK